MLSLETIKLALVTGIPLMLIWFVIGWITWEPVIGVTSAIITWIPFSIVKANGAFIIVFFIWFAAILLSYALIIGLFSGFILGNKKESQFEAINFSIILLLTLFWSYILITFWPLLNHEIQRFLTLLPFDTVDKGLSWLLALYIYYNLFLITEYFVVFLYREPYLLGLIERNYPELETITEIKNSKIYGTLYKDIAIFLILMVVTIPVLFIPIANFLTILFIWAWLYKESAFLGVCSYMCSNADLERLDEHRGFRIMVSLTASMFNFIPIVSVFTPFFLMSIYFHWIVAEKEA